MTMKFIDKLKDLFTDEEEVVETSEIELEKEEKEEEHKLPTFMRNKIEQEEKREEIRKQREETPKEDIISDREIVKTRSNSFSFPIDIDDEQTPRTFVNTSSSNYNTYGGNKNVLEKEKKVSELYAKKEEPKPRKFKPTPVISPVYGVLDKNYTKEEVRVQDEDSYEIKRPSRKVDFETVRNKAFGSLTDDIRNNLCENCELYKEVKITKNADKALLNDDNLLSDMTRDDVKDVTLEEAEDNYFDFGVDYEIPKKEERPNVVINAEEVEVKDSDVKIVNHNELESTAENC